MKINNYQGDLTNISAKKEALHLAHQLLCALTLNTLKRAALVVGKITHVLAQTKKI